jgi:hypothetical protein
MVEIILIRLLRDKGSDLITLVRDERRVVTGANDLSSHGHPGVGARVGRVGAMMLI